MLGGAGRPGLARASGMGGAMKNLLAGAEPPDGGGKQVSFSGEPTESGLTRATGMSGAMKNLLEDHDEPMAGVVSVWDERDPEKPAWLARVVSGLGGDLDWATEAALDQYAATVKSKLIVASDLEEAGRQAEELWDAQQGTGREQQRQRSRPRLVRS